jgi:capsular exopolysaccharide synthesis family protein
VAALSSALTQAELEVVKTAAERDAVKSMLTDPSRIRQLLSSPQYRGDGYTMRRELRDMQNSLEALSSTYLPGSDRLNAQLQRLERIKTEIQGEEKSAAEAVLADVERRHAAFKQQVEQYRTWLNSEQSFVLNVNSKQAEYDRLTAEINQLEKYSDQLNDQMKSIGLAESTGAGNVHVVEQATPNRMPVEPNLLKLLFMGCAAGLIFGAVAGLLLDIFDQRMRSAEEIKSVVGLPIMGVVPHIIQARTQAARGLMVHTEPMSDVAEAYRTVRTAIYFGQSGEPIKTLLITSPAPGDGKTTLAANLASAIAQAGNRVILLDCDFRKPTLHRVFEIDKKVGLSNVLSGDVSIEQATQACKVPGLHVVPCGPIPANPSEILNSQGFLELIDQLSTKYDLVLIDSPPVLPVTDARVLAASCDAVLLALRAEKTTRSAAISARDQLISVGGRVLGLVVNDVSRRRGVYSYYYADEGRYAYYHYGPRRPAQRNGSAAATNGAPALPPPETAAPVSTRET